MTSRLRLDPAERAGCSAASALLLAILLPPVGLGYSMYRATVAPAMSRPRRRWLLIEVLALIHTTLIAILMMGVSSRQSRSQSDRTHRFGPRTPRSRQRTLAGGDRLGGSWPRSG